VREGGEVRGKGGGGNQKSGRKGVKTPVLHHCLGYGNMGLVASISPGIACGEVPYHGASFGRKGRAGR
jgi:hypothetical protein